MKQHKKFISVIGVLLVLGFKHPAAHSLTIRFNNYIGDQPLLLSGTRYRNSFNEPFTVLQYKYYIAGCWIKSRDGEEECLLKAPHLLDVDDTASLTIHGLTRLTDLWQVRFIIGVDSAANVSGVQSGDMDPMLGMFWTWNTGYIYARLEGESEVVHAPAHRFTWDVGGYKAPFNAVRTVSLTLQCPDVSTIGIKADLLKWFDGKRPVRLEQCPVCHQQGALAMQLADNYSTMFSILPCDHSGR